MRNNLRGWNLRQHEHARVHDVPDELHSVRRPRHCQRLHSVQLTELPTQPTNDHHRYLRTLLYGRDLQKWVFMPAVHSTLHVVQRYCYNLHSVQYDNAHSCRLSLRR